MELHTKCQRPLGENSQLKWPSSQNLARTMFTSLQILTQMEKYIFKCLSLTQGTCTSARMTKARVEENALARSNLKIAAELEAVHTYKTVP